MPSLPLPLCWAPLTSSAAFCVCVQFKIPFCPNARKFQIPSTPLPAPPFPPIRPFFTELYCPIMSTVECFFASSSMRAIPNYNNKIPTQWVGLEPSHRCSFMGFCVSHPIVHTVKCNFCLNGLIHAQFSQNTKKSPSHFLIECVTFSPNDWDLTGPSLLIVPY